MGINRGTVLDLINDVNRAGGFRDYNSYSYIFDQVDTMPESKEDVEPHWIPVEQALPEESGEYLVTVKWMTGDNDVDVYEYDARHKTWNDGESAGGERAVAWMPLPEEYRGE